MTGVREDRDEMDDFHALKMQASLFRDFIVGETTPIVDSVLLCKFSLLQAHYTGMAHKVSGHVLKWPFWE